MSRNDSVSIVIPTLNCSSELCHLLLSMRVLKLDEMAEIIVVDAGSTDSTIEVAKHHDFVKLIELGFVSKGRARNEGIKQAKGDIIVNIDSDVDILEGWFEQMLQSMQYTDVVAGFSPDPQGKNLSRVSILIEGQDITFPTCNIAHRKAVFDKVGFFNETQNLAEDIEFNYRCVKAGYLIHYNPWMKLYHYQRQTKTGFAKQAFWNGEARYELNKLHPDMMHSHQHGASLKNILRLGFGAMGYVFGRYLRKKGEKVASL